MRVGSIGGGDHEISVMSLGPIFQDNDSDL